MSSATETMNPEDRAAAAKYHKEDETNEVSSSDEGGSQKKAGKKRSNPSSGEEDDKKSERRAANRRSAFQSRQRRKILIEDLQRTVTALSNDNGDLRKTNDELRVQLEAVLLENHQFRVQQQLSGQPGAGLMGAASLQTAQTQALLQGGGQSALSQLLAARGAAAQARGGDKMGQTQASTEAQKANASPVTSSKQSDHGIQGILNASALTGAGGAAGLSGLHSLLQNAGRSTQLTGLQGLLGAQAGGFPGYGAAGGAPLMGFLEQLRGGVPGGAGLSDIQRVLAQQQVSGDSQNNVSDALRALLQKNK